MILTMFLYEISNESPYAGSDAWQNRMIDTIHAYELRKPKQHPVGYTGDWTIANSTLMVKQSGLGISGGLEITVPRMKMIHPIGEGDRTKIVITDTGPIYGVWEETEYGHGNHSRGD
jgi:hypothetical protein